VRAASIRTLRRSSELRLCAKQADTKAAEIYRNHEKLSTTEARRLAGDKARYGLSLGAFELRREARALFIGDV
jgi:hypothetical protein